MAVLDSGDPLPPLPLIDDEGREVSVVGAETLLAFFHTECATSEMCWPYLERIGDRADGGGFRAIAVSQDPPQETREFLSRVAARVPTLYDPSPWEASRRLGLVSVPTFILVGPDGRIRDSAVGFDRWKLEGFAARAAALAGREESPLFTPGETAPAVRPG